MRIIGIGGLPRSGKDSLAELFIKQGYFGVSFGDIVRDFSRKRHKKKPDPISVTNMTETSNWLRETRGADVILQEALAQYKKAQKGHDYKGLVLFSVRAPVEVDWILGHKGELIWVEASPEIRHKRSLHNLRPGETVIDLHEFKRQEALQWQPQPGIPTKVQMNIHYVKEHSTRELINNGDDMAEFTEKAEAFINDIEATPNV